MMDKIINAQPKFAYRSHAELVMDLIRRKYGEITKPFITLPAQANIIYPVQF